MDDKHLQKNGPDASRAPNCLRCVYFKITWETQFPRSCGAFGFKCRDLPSREVFRTTGRHCPSFTPKEGLK